MGFSLPVPSPQSYGEDIAQNGAMGKWSRKALIFLCDGDCRPHRIEITKHKEMKEVIVYLIMFIGLFLGFVYSEPALEATEPAQEAQWELISDETVATVYNAVPSQCNADCYHTASMYEIIPERIEQDRILAMERTMMSQFGIAYGDSVLVQGAGRYDGVWQVQDTMNKRFRGQHKIDFLVPDNVRHGKWTEVKVYKKI